MTGWAWLSGQARRLGDWLASWSLRRRLLAGMLALLSLSSLAVGVASVDILHDQMVRRIDASIAAVANRGRAGINRDGDLGTGVLGGNRAFGAVIAPGQAVGTIGALLSGTRVISAAVSTESGRPVALTDAQAAALETLPADGSIRTIEVPGLGSYRAAVAASAGQATLVVALPLAGASAVSEQLALIIAALALIALILAGVIGDWVIRRSLAPLTRVTASARAVAAMPLDRGEVSLGASLSATEGQHDERTEVGQLGAAFDRMIGHVAGALAAREASEQKVRQFVADASHELRTPLASIRGYAELTRLSGEALPTDATHALGRIEAESVRMTHLVEDLLLLARLDEGRELVKRAVDLTALLHEVAADARVAGPDHPLSLELADQPLIVNGDEGRLRQVFINLLSNARVHTPEGTAVSLTALESKGVARISVVDNGPGIDPVVRESLFERFARADSSRSRLHGSTGLGLAIVDAVVRAHAGSIRVTSQPGETRFEVSLPLTPAAG